MTRILCWIGRHDWEHQRNSEVGGSDAAFDVCRRCHKEKPGYGKPQPGAYRGFG